MKKIVLLLVLITMNVFPQLNQWKFGRTAEPTFKGLTLSNYLTISTGYADADSFRLNGTTALTKGTWHSGIGASRMGALTVASLTSQSAISGTTGTFSGNISLTNAGTQIIYKSVSTQLLQILSDPSAIRGASMNLYGGTNANEGLLDVFYGNRDSTTAQLGGSFRIIKNSDGTATQMFRIDNLGNFYNRATVWMDSVRNLSNIGTLSSGAITSTGKSSLDSLRTNKIIFSGVAPPVQSYSLGADSANRRLLYTSYQVQRSVDLTHGIITTDVLDSNSVRETVLDSIQMAANFPSVGKIVRITLLGNYTLTGAGTCIIRLRHRNGATSDTTGTVLDSLILTNIASDKGLTLISTTTFRTVGATGSVVSYMKAETGTTVVTGGNILGATTINTTASNTFYITSKRSVTSDKVVIRQGWAETKN